MHVARGIVFLVAVVTVFNARSSGTASDGKHILPGTSAFNVNVTDDGDYHLIVNGETWLNRASTSFISNGRPFSTFDDTLPLVNTTHEDGADKLGVWSAINFHYMAGTAEIIASVRMYTQPPRPLVIFTQRYVNGANDTQALSHNYVISGFPSFKLEGSPGHLGYLSYGGQMAGDTDKRMGQWSKLTDGVRGGIAGGPLCIFAKSGNAVVISAFNQFMAASLMQEVILEGAVHWGIMGGVDKVPINFVYETIIYFSDSGINKAFEGWGSVLKEQYNRNDKYRSSDLTLNYLGYWTDGGAFYYYNTEKNKTYEQTVLDVKNYTDSLTIPYRYVQYDSWWYYKGPFGGDLLWEPMPSVFPHGLEYLYNKTGWPAGAHNRWWSSFVKYAKQNGGNFDFIIEIPKSVPVDRLFWDYLFNKARKWGLILYEQDWLHNEFEGMDAMLSDIHLGRQWLMQMGAGARKHGITILYCMSYSRMVLQSLEIPSVTVARVSDDYKPGNDQWRIGISSIFADAVGLAPFKDTFWTTTVQPGNPYGREEPYNALQAVVSTLSTAHMAPSDMIGGTNKSLLMRCCNEDGLILKPSRPAKAIDSQIIQEAFKDGSGPMGEVWSTYSTISGMEFGIILAADLLQSFNITPTLAGFSTNTNVSTVIYSFRDRRVQPFNQMAPYLLNACFKTDFCLLYTSPVLKVGTAQVVILGEMTKWVPVSSQRVVGISISDDVTLTIKGAYGEEVFFWFSVDQIVVTVTCNIGSSGAAELYLNDRICRAI